MAAISYSTTTGSTAWYGWCDAITSSVTSTTYSTDNTWVIWNGDWTSSSTTSFTTTSAAWSGWTTVNSYNEVARRGQYTPINETEETKRLRLERQAEVRRQQEERERKQKEANERADSLLKSFLTPEQVEQLDKLKCVIVTTPGGNTYKIERATVKELNPEGKVKASFCIHPDYSLGLPSGDSMLAKLLMLETDEKKFLKIANKTPYRMPLFA